MARPKFAAFDQGQIPTFAIIDQTGYFSGAKGQGISLAKLLDVFKQYTALLDKIWGVTANFEIFTLKSLNTYPKGYWPFLFLQNADVSGALAYHEFTPEGYPICKTFVQTTLQDGEDPVVSASHELAECLWDPAIQLCYSAPSDGLYLPGGKRARAAIVAGEISDAVQGDTFLIDKVPVSNFVYPAWFEAFNKSYKTQYDFMGRCKRPFEIRPGGYMPIQNVNRRGQLEWSQTFGSLAAKRGYNASAHHRMGVRKKLDTGYTHKELSGKMRAA